MMIMQTEDCMSLTRWNCPIFSFIPKRTVATLSLSEWNSLTVKMLWYLMISSIARNGVIMMPDTDTAGYEIPLIFTFSEIIASDKKTDRVKELQLSALGQLRSCLRHYKSLGYVDSLLYAIAEKKGKLILEITSKTEMDKLMKPRCPHFDGNKFVEDKYVIPEEEMICWSQTSLQGPLNEIGFKRYMELFQKYLPDAYEKHIKPHL